MTAHRIYATSNAANQLGPLMPMNETDRTFWRLLRERRAPPPLTQDKSNG